MDSVLLANLASRVGPDDALWIVGDFAFGPRAKDAKWLGGIFARLPGAEKHLVVGNHDGKATQDLPWSSVTQITEVSDGENANTVLCHYPMITWHRARKGGFASVWACPSKVARQSQLSERRSGCMELPPSFDA